LRAWCCRASYARGGHPILRWCAANVTVEQDHNENMKPSKKRSTERIDGISALVNALAVALPVIAGSVYDERPVLLVDL
jgi:phage terminase large subunit-like protein